MKTMAILAATLLAMTAHATGKPPTGPAPINVDVDTHAYGGRADADATSIANALAAGGQGGDGGDARAVGEGGAGGSATATQTATGGAAEQTQSQSADNAGNSQNINVNHRRNAPSVGQGSLVPSGCGAGVNGGGSQTGGAGFLGLAWTTDQCYALMAAASYAAIGMPDVSCDLLNSMKAVQSAHKRLGKPLPDCATAENRDPAPTVMFLSEDSSQATKDAPPTHAEVNEKIDRAMKKALEK